MEVAAVVQPMRKALVGVQFHPISYRSSRLQRHGLYLSKASLRVFVSS